MNLKKADTFGSVQSYVYILQGGADDFLFRIFPNFFQFPQSPTTFGFSLAWSVFATGNFQDIPSTFVTATSLPVPQVVSIYDISPSQLLSIMTGLANKYGIAVPVVGNSFPFVSNIWLGVSGAGAGFDGGDLRISMPAGVTPPRNFLYDFQSQLLQYIVFSKIVPTSAPFGGSTSYGGFSQQSEEIVIEDMNSSSGYFVAFCFPGPAAPTFNTSITFNWSGVCSYWTRPFKQSQGRPVIIDTVQPSSLQTNSVIDLDTSTIQIPSNYLAGEGNRPQ